MNHWYRRILAGVMAASCEASASAQSVSLTFDNDFLFSPRNDDWNYTGGISLEWSGPQVAAMNLTAPTLFLDRLMLGWSGVLDRFPNEEHALVFGGTSYTPHDLDTYDPIPDDRPYASLIFLAGRVRRTDDARAPTSALTTEFSAGLLGLRVADSVQTALHDATPGKPREPHGWSHQISDGGELTANYRIALDMLLFRRSASEVCDWVQAAAGAEASMGCNTYGWAGAQLKVGKTGKDYGTPGSIIGPLAGRLNSSRGDEHLFIRECYAFARAGGYAVAYNALLEGQFTKSDVTVSSFNVERLVDEEQFGFVLRASRLSMIYAITRRSAEFEGDLAESQFFGTATLVWSSDF